MLHNISIKYYDNDINKWIDLINVFFWDHGNLKEIMSELHSSGIL